MNVIIRNFRGYKYLINTNNINAVSFSPVDPKQYADEIAEAGGNSLTRIYIDWFNGSISLLVSSEIAEEFLNIFDAIELF